MNSKSILGIIFIIVVFASLYFDKKNETKIKVNKLVYQKQQEKEKNLYKEQLKEKFPYYPYRIVKTLNDTFAIQEHYISPYDMIIQEGEWVWSDDRRWPTYSGACAVLQHRVDFQAKIARDTQVQEVFRKCPETT